MSLLILSVVFSKFHPIQSISLSLSNTDFNVLFFLVCVCVCVFCLKFDCENYALYKDWFQVYRLKQLMDKKSYTCRQNNANLFYLMATSSIYHYIYRARFISIAVSCFLRTYY